MFVLALLALGLETLTHKLQEVRCHPRTVDRAIIPHRNAGRTVVSGAVCDEGTVVGEEAQSPALVPHVPQGHRRYARRTANVISSNRRGESLETTPGGRSTDD